MNSVTSDSFLQKVIDGTSDPLFVIDRDYNVVLANKAAAGRNNMGTSPRPQLPKCYEASHGRKEPCQGGEHACPLREVLATKKPVSLTHSHTNEDGELVVLEIVASPILDDDGEVTQIIESCRDVTDRVRAEEKARIHQEELAHVSRVGVMSEMASGLAHELNQPLAAIVNYVQACLERIRLGRIDADELLTDMEHAAAQAERAGEMIEHIREFVRKRQPLRATVNANDIIRQSVELTRPELRRNHVSIELDLEEDLPPIRAQAIQIEQVLVNLLRNGVEAMEEREHAKRLITIRSIRDGSNVQLSVSDTGLGLTEDGIDHVFDAYYTTKSDGMGMGLSICRSIIESHGGRMWVTSNPDQGVTFSLTLPTNEGDCENAI